MIIIYTFIASFHTLSRAYGEFVFYVVSQHFFTIFFLQYLLLSSSLRARRLREHVKENLPFKDFCYAVLFMFGKISFFAFFMYLSTIHLYSNIVYSCCVYYEIIFSSPLSSSLSLFLVFIFRFLSWRELFLFPRRSLLTTGNNRKYINLRQKSHNIKKYTFFCYWEATGSVKENNLLGIVFVFGFSAEKKVIFCEPTREGV